MSQAPREPAEGAASPRPGDDPTPRLATIGRLVATLFHQVNNPLALLKANVSYLDERVQAGETSGELGKEAPFVVEECADAVARMERLFAGVLRYARADQAQEDVDVFDCLETAYVVTGVVGRYAARSELVRPAQPIRIRASQGLVQHLLASVLLEVYARKATFGTVRIAVRAEPGGGARVEFDDPRDDSGEGGGPERDVTEMVLIRQMLGDLGGSFEEERREDAGVRYSVVLPA